MDGIAINESQKRRANDPPLPFGEHLPKKVQLHSGTMKSPGLTTSNRFASLGNNANLPTTPSVATKPKKPSIPPIVTTSMDLQAVRLLMDTAKVEKSRYFIKFMSIGTKILLQTRADYDNTIVELNKNKTQFFTHDIPSEKTTKFVLSGLHDMPILDIKSALLEAKINCLDIKKMRTKNKDQCLFLVYFEQKSITINTIKNVKSILSVIVKWSPYIASQNGPTQCNNCQLYGHGNRNCHLLPRCLLCAGQHNKDNCPSSKDINFVPTCSLCADHHISNDPNCPKRAEYLTMRKSTSVHQKLRTASSIVNNQNSPQMFNTISSKSNQHKPPPRQPEPQTSTSSATPLTSRMSPSISYANIVNGQPNIQAKDELFSTEELIQLTTELINNLTNCKTRCEQFQVVSNLAFKFVYSHHGP